MKKLNKKKVETIVKKAYEKTALEYTQIFGKDPNQIKVLKKFIKDFPKNSKILDVGCGAGVPATKFLSKKFNVLGADISSEMLKLARKNVPNAKFKRASMTELKFGPNSFDVICSFFAVFHIKKSEIPKMIKKFSKWLKPEGYLILSFGECIKNKEEILHFLKQDFYYASTPKLEMKKMLVKNGFKIMYFKPLIHKYGKAKHQKQIEFFIVGKKKQKHT